MRKLIWGVLLATASSVALAQTEAPAVVPPQVLVAPPANYPAGHTEAAKVLLRVTVSESGTVTGSEVLESGGPDFDAAAIGAVLHWKFSPALEDGKPKSVRIKIPFEFPALASAGSDGGNTSEADDGGLPEALIGPSDGGASTSIDDGGVAGVSSAFDAGPPPSVIALPPTATLPEGEFDAGPGVEVVEVRGARKKAITSASDFEITQKQVAALPVSKPSDLLQLAPGIFIANEGGAGHADQVFLRGFDAEQGQAIEFTVNGVPINEVDNTDGHGYADTHFIIPEVVKNLRVIEGPFDPHQGDFAEAGSADYQLGVTDRRLEANASLGNYNTQRFFLLWAPKNEREGTFAAAQFYQTAGYGSNRASTDASAMAQYEGDLGQRGLWRFLLTAYGTHFKTAGVVREDDYLDKKVDFYGTEDPNQGGDAQRYTLSFELENPVAEGMLTEQAFVTWRTLEILEDFTGFLLDPQEPGQTVRPSFAPTFGQRGDGIEQNYSALTVGDRASYKRTWTIFGLPQSLELGFYGRYDHTTPLIQRVRFGTQIPYRVDEDLISDVVNLAGYVDADLRITKYLTLRGGLRQEYFDYLVDNECFTAGEYIPRAPLDQSCPALDSKGYRLPDQRISATGSLLEPKGTALINLPWHLTLTGSYGVGAQSLDAIYISQDELAPFSKITSWESGVIYQQGFENFALSGRALLQHPRRPGPRVQSQLGALGLCLGDDETRRRGDRARQRSMVR
jgi:TonB family protein